MLTKNIYPVCARTLDSFILSNNKFKNLYNKLNPQLFDVSLRDGLQGLSNEDQKKFNITEKKILLHKIIVNHKPKNIEIGSIVSSKVLPIFKDTIPFSEYTDEYNKSINKYKTEGFNSYVVVPNIIKLNEIINNKNINNFSFITSVSNSFQLKNTKKSLEESDKDILEMVYQLDENMERKYKPNIKLYVSCINECPIEGKIDNDFIVNRILKLSKMNIDNICLSDTCGSLTIEDFEYIIETILFFGLQASKLSLHLHVKKGKEEIIEQIIRKALHFKIVQFDVSILETGGCSVTMKNENLAPNLSYELYYKALCKYIINNV